MVSSPFLLKGEIDFQKNTARKGMSNFPQSAGDDKDLRKSFA